MAKTITINEYSQNKNGIIFSGEINKKKLGSWIFQRDELYRPINLEVIPKAAILLRNFGNSDFEIYISYFLDESKKNSLDNNESGRYEPKLNLTLGNDGSGSYRSLFKKQIGTSKTKEHIEIKGVKIIDMYRTFELINHSKKIPTEKDWTIFHKESAFGLPYTEGYSDIAWTSIYNDFFEENQSNYDKFLNKLHKKTKIGKENISKIINIYPLDDNNQEIKENDLVRIIMNS